MHVAHAFVRCGLVKPFGSTAVHSNNSLVHLAWWEIQGVKPNRCWERKSKLALYHAHSKGLVLEKSLTLIPYPLSSRTAWNLVAYSTGTIAWQESCNFLLRWSWAAGNPTSWVSWVDGLPNFHSMGWKVLDRDSTGAIGVPEALPRMYRSWWSENPQRTTHWPLLAAGPLRCCLCVALPFLHEASWYCCLFERFLQTQKSGLNGYRVYHHTLTYMESWLVSRDPSSPQIVEGGC